MRLDSADGARVELRPVRYQFPAAAGPGRDWDANWLVVRGDVRSRQGITWSFTDPCLTTWEARSIGAWLRGAASGTVTPSPFGTGDEERLLVFTEPNIGLSLAARDDKSVTVRVHLSLESRPPDATGDEDLYDYFVPVTFSLAACSAAADRWDLDLAPFPVL